MWTLVERENVSPTGKVVRSRANTWPRGSSDWLGVRWRRVQDAKIRSRVTNPRDVAFSLDHGQSSNPLVPLPTFRPAPTERLSTDPGPHCEPLRLWTILILFGAPPSLLLAVGAGSWNLGHRVSNKIYANESRSWWERLHCDSATLSCSCREPTRDGWWTTSRPHHFHLPLPSLLLGVSPIMQSLVLAKKESTRPPNSSNNLSGLQPSSEWASEITNKVSSNYRDIFGLLR